MSTHFLSPKDISIRDRVLELERHIGNTPLFRLRNYHRNPDVKIYAKAEWDQLSGSVKARAAYGIIRAAIISGELHEGKILLDATSGNTGIAYATIAAGLGIKVTLCLPENATSERKEILRSLGVEIVYTSRFGGTDEAQEVAAELASKFPEKYFYASQYSNDDNWKAHYNGTAKEILEQRPDITHFVAGLGTTGTFTGTGRGLRARKSDVHLIALQPDLALHGLEGWKHLETAVVPQFYDERLADKFLEIGTQESYDIMRKAYMKDGLKLSPSSAANLAGAIRLADVIRQGVIVTVFPDNWDKYSEIKNKLFNHA